MKRFVFFANVAVGILFFLSLVSIDSESWWPLILCVVSWIWLAFAAYRNGWFYDPERDEDHV